MDVDGSNGRLKHAAHKRVNDLDFPVYECVMCGHKVSYSDLMSYASFRCPRCGYRIFRKGRTPIVKHLKAR